MHRISHSTPNRQTRHDDPTTPQRQPLPGITPKRFSLFRFRSPLLPESQLFSLPTGTEMFHFPAFPPHTLCVQMRVTAHNDCRVSPFGHPRITARLTAPRGLSRPPTSFIGSWYQGIHRAPLTTCAYQMLAFTVQFSSNDRHPQTPRTHPPHHQHPPHKQASATQQFRHKPKTGNPRQQPPRPFPQDPTAHHTQPETRHPTAPSPSQPTFHP